MNRGPSWLLRLGHDVAFLIKWHRSSSFSPLLFTCPQTTPTEGRKEDDWLLLVQRQKRKWSVIGPSVGWLTHKRLWTSCAGVRRLVIRCNFNRCTLGAIWRNIKWAGVCGYSGVKIRFWLHVVHMQGHTCRRGRRNVVLVCRTISFRRKFWDYWLSLGRFIVLALLKWSCITPYRHPRCFIVFVSWPCADRLGHSGAIIVVVFPQRPLFASELAHTNSTREQI